MNTHDLQTFVLSGLLNGGATPDAFDVIATTPVEAFAVPFFRRMFGEIRRQALADGLIDMMLISEALGGDETFANIAELMRIPSTVANLPGYAKKLVKAWRSAEIGRLLADGAQAVQEAANQDLRDQAIEAAVTRLIDITADQGGVQPVHIQDILPRYMDTIQARMDGSAEVQTLRSGIAELDAETGGFNKQDLVVVAGRPGMGKTEFALKIVDGATSAGGGALVFSMEMAQQQIVERSVAGAGNMSVSRLRNPREMGDEDWARLSSALEHLNRRDVWIVDATDLTVEQIRAVAETHKRRYPQLSMIMVDYIGLIRKPKAERNDLAVGHISRSLKTMAMRLHTPVFALSQLSRAVDSRPAGSRRPVMSDLRDSGSIEQDADSILLLYRDEVYNPDSPAEGIAEVILGKSRFSAAGKVVYQQFKNGHFLPIDQLVAQEKVRMQHAAQQPQKRQKRYSTEEF